MRASEGSEMGTRVVKFCKTILLVFTSFFYSCNDCYTTCYIYPDVNENISLVATSKTRWTGLAVSNDLSIFACYPNWSSNHSISVVDVTDTLNLKPYPDLHWNTWSGELNPAEHFICVQSLFVDKNNYLWILDSGNPQRNGKFLGVIGGGAKLLKIDLNTNTVVQTIIFKGPIVNANSYLNDIRIDEGKNIGYITDSNEGAIIVVNLQTGGARRLLDEHASTKSENKILVVEGKTYKNSEGEYPVVHSDGIELSPDREFLYWRSLTAQGLYRIKTNFLNSEAISKTELGNNVEYMGSYFPPSDGIMFGSDGLLYMTSIEENGIRAAHVERKVSSLINKSKDIKWPDSFSMGADGYVYFTTSQGHIENPTESYKIFKFKP